MSLVYPPFIESTIDTLGDTVECQIPILDEMQNPVLNESGQPIRSVHLKKAILGMAQQLSYEISQIGVATRDIVMYTISDETYRIQVGDIVRIGERTYRVRSVTELYGALRVELENP